MTHGLSYNPETGVFIWVDPPKNHRRLSGSVAGHVRNGYVVVKINGIAVKGHRLAWFMSHGAWPDGEIDHANGDRSDNRICNLRIATNPQNQANRRRNQGKKVAKGVRRQKNGRFQSRIKVGGKAVYLGVFSTEEDASDAYLAAAVAHYGQFARRD